MTLNSLIPSSYVHLQIYQSISCCDIVFHENSIVPMYKFFISVFVFSLPLRPPLCTTSCIYVLIDSHFLSLDHHLYIETLIQAWVCPTRPYICLRLYIPQPFFRRNTNQNPLQFECGNSDSSTFPSGFSTIVTISPLIL